MSKKMIFLAIALLLVQIIVAMNPPMDQTAKIYSIKKMVLNLVFSNYLTSHEMVCACAETNKHYHNLLLEIAKKRQYAMIRCPDKDNFGCFLHRYGTANYFAYRELGTTQLSMGYCEFGGKNHRGVRFPNFVLPLPCKQKPFVDGNWAFCFHGYGSDQRLHRYNKYVDSDLVKLGIVRYCLNDCSQKLCYLRIGEKNDWPLDTLLSYPNLLYAILNTNGIVMNGQKDGLFFSRIEYSLATAMIPDNYHERIEFDAYQLCCAKNSPSYWRTKEFFVNFPCYIKNAIEMRYQECCEIKNRLIIDF